MLLILPLDLLTLMEHHCTGKVKMVCFMKITTRLKETQRIKDLFLPRNKTLEGRHLPVFLASGFQGREAAGTWILTNLMLLKTAMRSQARLTRKSTRLLDPHPRTLMPCAGTITSSPAAADDDDDVDLFGSSDEEESEEKKRITEERLKAYHEKKSKKAAVIAKTSVLLDVK